MRVAAASPAMRAIRLASPAGGGRPSPRADPGWASETTRKSPAQASCSSFPRLAIDDGDRDHRAPIQLSPHPEKSPRIAARLRPPGEVVDDVADVTVRDEEAANRRSEYHHPDSRFPHLGERLLELLVERCRGEILGPPSIVSTATPSAGRSITTPDGMSTSSPAGRVPTVAGETYSCEVRARA